MRVWRDWMRGCKFLVIRRDATVPKWEWFVLGARDPAAPMPLRAYAAKARSLGMDQEYCQSVLDMADRFEKQALELGLGDPDKGPHRTDHEGVVDLM